MTGQMFGTKAAWIGLMMPNNGLQILAIIVALGMSVAIVFGVLIYREEDENDKWSGR